MSEYVATLSPHATSGVAVAWAGEDRSENWMDTGREYTKRWHHQTQIRDAVEADGLFQRRWFYPVLDLSVRAFRRSYKDVPAAIGTAVVFEVEAEGDNVWSVIREVPGWSVVRGRAPGAAAGLRADAAWKLLYNALAGQDASMNVFVEDAGAAGVKATV